MARVALHWMPAAIDAARLAKHEYVVLSAWYMAAECVVQRVDLDLGSHLAKATKECAAHLDKMLGRRTKGQDTNLSHVDF